MSCEGTHVHTALSTQQRLSPRPCLARERPKDSKAKCPRTASRHPEVVHARGDLGDPGALGARLAGAGAAGAVRLAALRAYVVHAAGKGELAELRAELLGAS